MQKLRFFFLLMLLPSLLYSQQLTKIIIRESEFIKIDNISKITHIKKPVFEHDGAILTSDSARLWQELNYFEAFGNVHINQDTINIYSDLLNYDGNAKMAHLINKVRMSDPSSLLTTNVFDYNMATKVGIYMDNGKIENRKEGTTVTSKKGYYLSSTKDAYFRHNVKVVTDSVTITSDSLRYNTFSNQTYFYGPTDIKGKNDNLYTENGEYNTKTKKAFFGKKNLYTQGTKSLKGDSLYYDGIKGYGKAVKNITYNDTQDKLLLKGQLGEYFKEGERIIVKINAYVGMGSSDSVTVDGKLIPDTLWLGADILEAERSLQKSLSLIQKPTVLQDDEIGVEEEKPKTDALAPNKQPLEASSSAKPTAPKVASKVSAKQSKKDQAKEKAKKDKAPPPDSLETKLDSVKRLADSTSLDLNIVIKKDSLTKDSLLTSKQALIKDSTKLDLSKKVPDKKDTSKVAPNKAAITNPKAPVSLTKPIAVKDSLPFNPADTVRTRTIKAYHNVRVYKTNLQAKSDSLFFTAADSTLRLYKNPILWADSSQQTGDTIHVQFKDKKINSAQVIQNAFIADQETDTTKFNQIKGKIITAFFNKGEIRNMYVDGNAESISYDKKKDGQYQQNQTLSARIKITFEDKEISIIKEVKGIEGTFSPPNKVPKEGLLTGFIWKPELRPKSKNDIIKGNTIKAPDKDKVASPKPKVPQKTTTKKPVTTVKKA
ncbi:OstA-like protein [Pedobacter sp. Du54]|uniref:OstA-like protein n=1 Tax=Pedobacter anseongensis TaxID=3133439 RepID=UPI0030B4BB5D